MSTKLIPCIGCGALVPDIAGPSFGERNTAYGSSDARYPQAGSPGCWAIYGDVLLRQYADARTNLRYFHTVDAYAVQHPGLPTPQTIQSVNVHLISLCYLMERGYSSDRTEPKMRLAIQKFKGQFTWLAPPASKGAITVVDVAQAVEPDDLIRCIEAWSKSAWEAWSVHHPAVRMWVEKLESG